MNFVLPNSLKLNLIIFRASLICSASPFSQNGGQLRTYEIQTDSERVDLYECETETVKINPSKGRFQLLYLFVRFNKLKAIPDNVCGLTRLRELVLNDNEITTVEMSDLNCLTNLEVIALHRNRIITVSAWQSVRLPKLRDLYLDQNQLSEFSFAGWNVPALRRVHLFDNNLKVVEAVSTALPSLKTLRIYDNPLNCFWVKAVTSKLHARNIRDIGNMDCEQGSTFEAVEHMAEMAEERKERQKSTENSQLELLVRLLQQQNELLTKKLQKLEDHYTNLTNVTPEQKEDSNISYFK